jgi:hypothetical protein
MDKENIGNTIDRKLVNETTLKKINTNQDLGFTWRPKLRQLLDDGEISKDRFDQITNSYVKSKSDSLVKLKNKLEPETEKINTKCEDCGDIINSGTYGVIFNDIKNGNIAIKGSTKGVSTNSTCPEEFLKESNMHEAIKRIFPTDLTIINLLNITQPVWVENSRCYFRMEKLLPVVFNEHERELLNNKIEEETDRDMKYRLETIRDIPQLYMLVPGIIDPEIYFNEGGGANSHWREINGPMMEIIFEILGININTYYEELKKILRATIENNIYLIDVEFILCSIIKTNENGISTRENKIVMIDFDKVIDNTASSSSSSSSSSALKRETINQDMFPKSIKEILGGTKRRSTKRKYKKRSTKRKYKRRSTKRRKGTKKR